MSLRPRAPKTSDLPVGMCIYCGSTEYEPSQPGKRLGDEHTLPFSLGGNHVLPQASCRACERKINIFETACARMIFGPVRLHLGIQTRNPSQRPETLPMTLIMSDDPPVEKVVEIPVEECPVMIALVHFKMPRLLVPSTEGDRTVVASMIPSIEEVDRRRDAIAAQHGAISAVMDQRVAQLELRRLIAKISHSIAVGHFGIDGFLPLLPDFILTGDDRLGREYVGAFPREKSEQTKVLHEQRIDFVPYPGGRRLLLSGIRLFAEFTGVEFCAAIGWLKPTERARVLVSEHDRLVREAGYPPMPEFAPLAGDVAAVPPLSISPEAL